MSKIINSKLLVRRDSSQNWILLNPILKSGEIGYDTTIGKHKIGNGVDRLVNLPFFALDIDLNDKITCILKTTEEWEENNTLISQKGTFYIYTDYQIIQKEGQSITIPGIKIGDGLAFVVDLPFITDFLADTIIDHINNYTMHITQQEREFWNNKVTSYIAQRNNEELVLDKGNLFLQ